MRLLPRKTRPERRWDLISAWRHGRKLVPLGGKGWSGGVGATLNVFPEKRERDVEQEQSSSSHSTQPAVMADVQSLFAWVAYFNPYSASSALFLPVTLSQPSQLDTSP